MLSFSAANPLYSTFYFLHLLLLVISYISQNAPQNLLKFELSVLYSRCGNIKYLWRPLFSLSLWGQIIHIQWTWNEIYINKQMSFFSFCWKPFKSHVHALIKWFTVLAKQCLLTDKQTLKRGLYVIVKFQTRHIQTQTGIQARKAVLYFTYSFWIWRGCNPVKLILSCPSDTWRESSRKSGLSVGSWVSRILRALCVKSVVEYFPSWPHATPSSSWRSYPQTPGPSHDP